MEEYVWVSKFAHRPICIARVHPILRSLAEQYKVKVTIAGPDDGATGPYVQAVHAAVQREAAGIMVIGWGGSEIVAAIDAAVERGIPVVTVDSDVPDSARIAHVGTDWFRLGGAMADRLASLMGRRGKALMIGMCDLPNVQSGFRGFQHRMAACPEVELLGPEDDLGVGSERAEAVVTACLGAHPDLAAVAAFDGSGGPGAAIALEKAGAAHDVRLVCVDAEAPHLAHVRTGVIDAAFAQKRESFTYLAFQMLYAYNHGSAVTGYRPGPINVPGNIDTGYVVVTKDNIDSFEIELGLDEVLERHELTQRLALVSSMVENSAEFALATDVEGQIVYANPACGRVLGFDPGQMLGFSFETVFDLTEEQRAEAKRCVAEGRSLRFEALARKGDGAPLSVHLSLSPLKTNAMVRGMVLIATDITERVRAEAALRASEEKLRLIYENAFDGISVYREFPENGTHTLIDCNERYAEMAGRRREELLEIGNITLIQKKLGIPMTAEEARRVRREKIPYRGTFSWVRPDGKENIVEYSTAPIEVDGKPLSIGLDRDITERVRMEEALRESEERLGLIFENASDGISIYEELPESGTRRLVDCNERYAEMAGRSKEELLEIGNTLPLQSSIVPTAGRDEFLEALREGRSFRGLFSWIRPDGKDNVVEYTAMPIQVDENTLIIGFDRDVTERMRAEEALREQRDFLDAVVDMASEGIFVVDERGQLVLYNRRMREITGYSRGDAERPGFAQLLCPDLADRARALEAIKAALNGVEAIDQEWEIARASGERRHVLISTKAFSRGQRRLLLGVVHDITDRKRSEEALRESEKRYRRITTAITDYVYTVHIREGHPVETIHGPACVAVTGYTSQEFEVNPYLWIEMVHERDRDAVREQAARVLTGKEWEPLEHRIVRKDGVTRWVRNTPVPHHDDQGRLLSYDGLIQDITERKEAEAQVRRRLQEMTLLNEITTLVASAGDLAEALQGVCAELADFLQVPQAGFAILNAQRTAAEVIADYYPPDRPAAIGVVLPVAGNPSMAYVLQHKAPLAVVEAQSDPLLEPVHEIMRRRNVHSILIVPIIVDGQVIGTLGFDAYQRRVFSVEDIDLVQHVASQIGQVLKRTQAESALRESEERYRTTIDAMGDLIHVVDRDLRVVLCNEALREAVAELGQEEDPLGREVFELFPFLPPQVRADYQEVLETGEPLVTEEVTQIRDRTVWTEARKIPILDEGGTVYRIVTIVRYVTERKRAEEALRQSEERFRELAELLPEIVFEMDERGVLTFANRQAFEVTGYTQEDFERGFEAIDLIVPADRDRARQNVVDVIQGKAHGSQEYTAQRKDGSRFPVLARSTPIVRDGRPIGLRGILFDVSDSKRAEREKRELESKLERARMMESLGMLAGGVAHDLNNILGPLVAYPDLILIDLPPDSSCREDVLRIQEAAERAASIVEDLLTLARRGAYRMVPLNLNVIVQEYLRSPSFGELQAKNPEVYVDVSLAEDLLNLSGSAPHLSKVLMNLVTNAFEAMPRGGRLTIETFCRSLDRPLVGRERIEAGDYVILAVEDTGVGIEEEDLERIFEPFYTKKEMGQSGSGLGLAVVRGVVHDHKGRIDLKTEVDRGTSFHLYFPVTREALVQVSEESDDLCGDESVLVVDDLPRQRDLAVRLLSSLGYRARAVENGRAAVAYLQEHHADILVLDMIMEDDFDGLDTYRQVVQVRPGQKAVIASGYSETGRVKEAQRLGAGPFIRKPYTLNRLGRAVRSELDL